MYEMVLAGEGLKYPRVSLTAKRTRVYWMFKCNGYIACCIEILDLTRVIARSMNRSSNPIHDTHQSRSAAQETPSHAVQLAV